jgi:hypothetical protein
MARPIRIDNIELDPQRNLSPAEFIDYENLEERFTSLSQLEKRYYFMLRKLAYLHHVLSVNNMDKFMPDGFDYLEAPRD